MPRTLILLVIILALCISAATAQVFTPISRDVIFGLNVRPLFARESLDLREDQFVRNFSVTRAEFSGELRSLSGLFKGKLSVIPGFSSSETVTPIKTLQIGAVDFGPKAQQQSSGQGQQQSSTSQKPVDITFREKTNWRLELAGPPLLPIRPFVVLDSAQCEFTADGEKDGQRRQETESVNRLFWGIGGSLRYRGGGNLTEVALAGSNDYFRVEGSLSQIISQTLGLSVGYYYQKRSWPILKQKENGVFASIMLAF